MADSKRGIKGLEKMNILECKCLVRPKKPLADYCRVHVYQSNKKCTGWRDSIITENLCSGCPLLVRAIKSDPLTANGMIRPKIIEAKR